MSRRHVNLSLPSRKLTPPQSPPISPVPARPTLQQAAKEALQGKFQGRSLTPSSAGGSRRKTRKNREDKCYVVYGTGFNPIKIKGQCEKNALLERIKKQGFNPKYSLIAGTCSRKGTIYNKIKGAVTIK